MVETGESRDGTGSSDHDTPWSFGHLLACLTAWQQAHLLVLRGHVKDHEGATVGDDGVAPAPSGLAVPTPYIGRYWHDDPEAP